MGAIQAQAVHTAQLSAAQAPRKAALSRDPPSATEVMGGRAGALTPLLAHHPSPMDAAGPAPPAASRYGRVAVSSAAAHSALAW